MVARTAGGGGARGGRGRGGGRPRAPPPASSTTTRARSGSSTGRGRACPRSRRCSARATSAGSSTGCRARCPASRRWRAGSASSCGRSARRVAATTRSRIGKVASRHRVTICVADLEPSIRRFHGVFLHPRRGLIASTPDWIGRTHTRSIQVESTAFSQRYELLVADDQDEIVARQLLSPSLVVWLAEHPLAPGLRDPRRDARGVRGPAARGRGQPHLPARRHAAAGRARARRDARRWDAAGAAGAPIASRPVGFAPHARGPDRRVRRSRGAEGRGPAHARAG